MSTPAVRIMRAVSIASLVTLAGAAAASDSLPTSSLSISSLYRAEFRVSTFRPSAQEQASIALLPGKGSADELVAAWASRRQREGHYGVYAQRLSSDGVAIGDETPLSLWTASHATDPSIATTRDGRVIAAWQSFNQDGDQGAIIARVLSRDGDRLVGGDELLVNQTTIGDQHKPVVAASSDGSAMVAWISASPDGQVSRVMARIIGSDGVPIGDELVIVEGDASLWMSVAATTSAGGFAVSYSCADAASSRVCVRTIGADGAVGDEVVVNTGGVEPVIAGGPNGYVLAWAAVDAKNDVTSVYSIFTAVLDARGVPTTGAIAVSHHLMLDHQNAPTIAMSDDGSFVIAFNSHAGDTNVAAQRFDASGTAIGSIFSVSAVGIGDQKLALSGTSRAVALTDGTLAVAWSGTIDESEKSGAAVTLVSSAPFSVAERGVTGTMAPSLSTAVETAQPHVPPTFDRRQIDTSPRAVEFNQRGIGFDAVVNTGWTPPDPHMAVGPNHVMVMTNGAIAAYRKSDGVLTFQNLIEGASGFWGSLGATGFVFDPEVLYDGISGRYFAMAAEAYAPGNKSYVLIAVSDDSDPNGSWHKYRFDTSALSGDLFDSPNIGVTNDAVVVTGDGFGISSNYPIYTWDKASLLAGNPPAVSKSGTLSTTTQSAGIPAVSYDTPPALYMIEHKEGGTNTSVRLIAVRNLLGTYTFTFHTLTVPSYAPPGDPAQKGTTSRPESFDARFWSAAYRDGSLWATHHTNTPVQARWYEVAMNGWPTSGFNPTLVQSGTIDPGGSINTTFSAINVSENGNAAIVYAYSSANDFLSMATSQRRECDPLGTMDAPVIRKASNAGYTSGRWGDYSAIQADPVDPTVFWAVHEYANGQAWRTWVQSFTVSACTCPADFNGDGFVTGDDFDLYVEQFELGDISADFNGDGFVTGDDFDQFVVAFEEGCF